MQMGYGGAGLSAYHGSTEKDDLSSLLLRVHSTYAVFQFGMQQRNEG